MADVAGVMVEVRCVWALLVLTAALVGHLVAAGLTLLLICFHHIFLLFLLAMFVNSKFVLLVDSVYLLQPS